MSGNNERPTPEWIDVLETNQLGDEPLLTLAAGLRDARTASTAPDIEFRESLRTRLARQHARQRSPLSWLWRPAAGWAAAGRGGSDGKCCWCWSWPSAYGRGRADGAGGHDRANGNGFGSGKRARAGDSEFAERERLDRVDFASAGDGDYGDDGRAGRGGVCVCGVGGRDAAVLDAAAQKRYSGADTGQLFPRIRRVDRPQRRDDL